MRVTYCHLLTEGVSLVSLLQSRGGCDRKMDHIGKKYRPGYYLASDFGVDSVQVTSCSAAEYAYRGNRPHECKFVLRRRGSKERWLHSSSSWSLSWIWGTVSPNVSNHYIYTPMIPPCTTALPPGLEPWKVQACSASSERPTESWTPAAALLCTTALSAQCWSTPCSLG